MTAAVLDIARSWLGEKEDPPHSNHCGITEWFADTSGLEWTRRGNPWCDMSVSKWLSDAGLPTLYAYCPTHVNAFKLGTAGKWIGGGDPLPGDVVFFDWDHDGVADHVGLVEVVNSNGTVTTIEGNVGDAVRRQVRGRGVIIGFGRPNYKPAPPPQPPAQHHTEDDMTIIYQRGDGADVQSFVVIGEKLVFQDQHEVMLLASKGAAVIDHCTDKSWENLVHRLGDPDTV